MRLVFRCRSRSRLLAGKDRQQGGPVAEEVAHTIQQLLLPIPEHFQLTSAQLARVITGKCLIF